MNVFIGKEEVYDETVLLLTEKEYAEVGSEALSVLDVAGHVMNFWRRYFQEPS